jgi:hypothetical protein
MAVNAKSVPGKYAIPAMRRPAALDRDHLGGQHRPVRAPGAATRRGKGAIRIFTKVTASQRAAASAATRHPGPVNWSSTARCGPGSAAAPRARPARAAGHVGEVFKAVLYLASTIVHVTGASGHRRRHRAVTT